MSRRLLASLAAAALALACAGPRPANRPQSSVPVSATDPGMPAERASRGPTDPWPATARALMARRLLDSEAEVDALLTASAAAPAGPLALLAMRRLAELAEESPARSAQVEAGVARLLAGGRLQGVTAYRARVARALAAEVRGDHAAAARHRAENGAVTAWTVTGPWSELHALEFERPIPPEEGLLPAEAPAPAGLPAYRTRTIPTPDGTFALEGEPPTGDVFGLVSEAALSRGGRYLLSVSTGATVRVLVDGAVVHERRAYAAWLPGVVYLPLELGPGRHRLVVKLSRTDGTGGLSVSLARADGTRSDVAWSAPAAGAPPPPAAAPPAPTGPTATSADLVRALEPDAGPVLARLLAARDALVTDRETAKALLAEALVLAPGSTSVLVATAAARLDDPTLDRRAAQTRAESALRDALKADPGHAEARVMLALLLRATERLDDAEEVLTALTPPAAGRPLALAARARCAEDRGLLERAESLASEALAAGGSCEAAGLALGLATRRQALSRASEDARIVAACRGGRERLARDLARRGDPAGAEAALVPYLAARPWDIDAAVAEGETFLARGKPGAAVEHLAALADLWPRSPRVALALASAQELAGDAAAARATRERALLLDGSDLGLRRALALEDGREVLDDLSQDARAAIAAYERAPRKNGTSAVMVLDAAEVDIHPGAVATERTQQVIHVLDQAGVEQHGEVSIPAGAQVIAARTIKPDGRALEPEHGDDGKGTLSLSGLEPGDYVQVDYVRAVRAPFGTLGYAADAFYFAAPRERLFRSTYVVRAPAGAGLEVDAHGMPAPAVVREGGGEVMRSEVRDAPPYVPEPDAPAMIEVLPAVEAGTGAAREAFQRGVADRLAGRALPTLELRTLARQIRAEATGPLPEGLVRAAYARVAKAVLGEGSSMEDASEALSRGRGSRLLVLKAVLEALGIEARVALIRPFGADPASHRFPGPAIYASQLLRVRTVSGTIWLDPSVRLNPFGAIPDPLTGCEALVLPEPGEAPVVDRTPERSPVADGKKLDLKIELSPDGSAAVSGSDRYSGALGAVLKSQLEPLDASQRRQAVEGMLGRMFQGITLSDLAFDGEEDPDAPLVIRWRGRSPHVARAAEGGLVIEPGPIPPQLGARYVRLASRTTPLLLQSADASAARVELVPPPGLRVLAGAPARIDTPFGVYRRTDRAEGSGLVRDEELTVFRGRIAPERYRDFSAFVAKVDGLRESPVRLTR